MALFDFRVQYQSSQRMYTQIVVIVTAGVYILCEEILVPLPQNNRQNIKKLK